MSIFLDRRPRSSRYLEWKIRIFSVAAVVAIAGMYLDQPWVTGTALFLLLLGMLLRFLPEPPSKPGSDPGEPQ